MTVFFDDSSFRLNINMRSSQQRSVVDHLLPCRQDALTEPIRWELDGIINGFPI